METPDDVFDLLHRRLPTKRPEYGFAARAEAQSGMAGSEAYFRRQRPTPPRTPEELRPLQERWFDALKRLSPNTALRVEVVRQEALESLWPDGAPRTQDGGIPHAANLSDTIYLSADALRDNAPQVNRVNLLHEVAHSYERSLPLPERQALRQQWQEEMASRQSPLHDEVGNLHPEVDPRAATDFSEWLAERVAWENEGHFAGRIEPQAAPQSAVARFVAGLRALVLRTWQAIRPDAHPGDLSARFRQWLSAGGRMEENLGFDSSEQDAQFVRRGAQDRASLEDGGERDGHEHKEAAGEPRPGSSKPMAQPRGTAGSLESADGYPR